MRSLANRHVTAFSKIELIAVLAIIVIAILLMPPGVERCCEADRRVKCNHNQRNLALACHSANDTNGSMPPYDSRVMPADNPYSNNGGNYGSLFYALLPYVCEVNYYNGGAYPLAHGKCYAASVVHGSLKAPANFSAGPPIRLLDYMDSPPERNTGLTSIIKGYICPSDQTAQATQNMAPNGWAGTSYACNFLVFGNSAVADVNDPDGLGGSKRPGAWGQKVTLAESFPDGIAFTILFAEKFVSCDNGTTGTAWAWPNHDSSFAPAVAMESPWNDGTRFQFLLTAANCQSQYAQTGHAGGMNVVMADGSGRSLSFSLSALTYQHAMQPNDGAKLGPDW
jgi:hypothetical protein